MLERIPPREWRDLAIAWFAITLAFTVAFLYHRFVQGIPIPLGDFLFIFAVSAVTVGVGFVLHELAHKFAALRYGYWAEFRKHNLNLLIAVAFAAMAGVVFAAPGATVVYGTRLTPEQNGRISASGPLANLLLALPFVALALLGTGAAGLVGSMGWKVNAMLATFNLLPFGILDGKKVLAWNPVAFVALIGAAVALLLLSYSPSLLF